MNNEEFNPDNYKLAVGQIWKSIDDYTLEIVKINNGEVTVKEIETGDTYIHELDGSDGFQDFLYWNNYIVN